MFSRRQYLAVVIALLTCWPALAQDQEESSEAISAEGLEFFEQKIQPVLVEHCYKCHSAAALEADELEGELFLDSRAGVRRGGESGEAVVPGDLDASMLIDAIHYETYEMPPEGKLSAEIIADFERWIEMGAPDPRDGDAPQLETEEFITDADREYWAYRPLVRPELPKVMDRPWVTNPIDGYILARLEEAGIEPSLPAERAVLIRRATYDLTGLPPTPEEVAAFVEDRSPDAYSRLIDRLLESPQYGERWGRHWLDLVRYAETNGYEFDEIKQNAWRYRDYVVAAFNDDKPYDQFVLEQLAGDELPDANDESLTATGFYRLGIFDTHAADPQQRDYDMYDDVVSTTSQVFMGMTVGCARCHDHKRDPIEQEDYYRLLAFMHNIRPHAGGNTELSDGTKTLAVSERGARPGATHVLVRGNPGVRGDRVVPGFPRVLGFDDPEIPPPPTQSRSGRRLVLAQWMASRDNPLTARVMVNRIWQHHFGRGIVPTPNDFGKLGRQPTHPDLLNWLAVEFMHRGWSVKEMHRLIMHSTAYRMSSLPNDEAFAADPNNDLFWRFNMRRLSAEEIRDSILVVDGTLELTVGGPSVYPEIPIDVLRSSSKFVPAQNFVKEGFWQRPQPEYEVRRSVYTFVRRSLLPPMMAGFDIADTDSSCAERFTTTVPTQALTMLNSQFMQDHAELFAHRIVSESSDETADQVRRGLELVTQRPPSPSQIEHSLRLIEQLEGDGLSHDEALRVFCLMALNLNEFVYID